MLRRKGSNQRSLVIQTQNIVIAAKYKAQLKVLVNRESANK